VSPASPKGFAAASPAYRPDSKAAEYMSLAEQFAKLEPVARDMGLIKAARFLRVRAAALRFYTACRISTRRTSGPWNRRAQPQGI